MYNAKILADSISLAGHRLTTFEVTIPRIVLAEFNTHRMLSRNSASSRAIPVEKRIAAVEADPFVPDQFGKNKKGMQHDEVLEGQADVMARLLWDRAKSHAIFNAESLAKEGVHKQLANRLIEPFSWHTIIVTATEWWNYFNLRCNENAQPEIRIPSEMMRELYMKSVPQPLSYDEWHLPLVRGPEYDGWDLEVDGMKQSELARLSAARCARVSYLTHDGKRDVESDMALYERLTKNGHVSPLEHPARPMTSKELKMFEQPMWKPWENGELVRVEGASTHYLGNFNGWVQLRKLLPGEAVFGSSS